MLGKLINKLDQPIHIKEEILHTDLRATITQIQVQAIITIDPQGTIPHILIEVDIQVLVHLDLSKAVVLVLQAEVDQLVADQEEAQVVAQEVVATLTK